MNNTTDSQTATSPDSVNRTIRAVIIDDDPIIARYMQARLTARFDGIDIETQNEPIAAPGMDIYMVDNQFGERAMASTLVEEIKRTTPEALIIIMSSTLDYALLSFLMNRGCNGIYDKKTPLDNEIVFELIADHIKAITKKAEKANRKPSFLNRIQSLFGKK
jgi:DNA-binding NarL/FixJ family response regulator